MKADGQPRRMQGTFCWGPDGSPLRGGAGQWLFGEVDLCDECGEPEWSPHRHLRADVETIMRELRLVRAPEQRAAVPPQPAQADPYPVIRGAAHGRHKLTARGARAVLKASASPPAEEYLSIAELAKRIPYRAQTIRNLKSQGVFRLNVHYVKPRGRVMFLWSAMRAWVDTPEAAAYVKGVK